MALFEGGGLVVLALIVFWLWALYDVITVDPNQVRNLPKIAWLLLILLFPPIGSIAAAALPMGIRFFGQSRRGA